MSKEEKNKNRKGNPALYKGMKSLNPAGRPKGSLNKWNTAAMAVILEGSEEVAEVCVKLAKEGNPHCIKIVMDRAVPTQKAIDANSNKGDAQVIINVASIESIEQKAKEFDEAELVDPEEMTEDEVIASINTSPMTEKFND